MTSLGELQEVMVARIGFEHDLSFSETIIARADDQVDQLEFW